MPGQYIDHPNPETLPSHIPDIVDQLEVNLDRIKLDDYAYDGIHKFRRAASYIAAGEKQNHNQELVCRHTLTKQLIHLHLLSNDIPTR